MKSKFRFIFTALITLILCFSLSGCKEWNWQFEQSVENVASIEIVEVLTLNSSSIELDKRDGLYKSKYKTIYNPKYNIIKKISEFDYPTIMMEVEKMYVVRYFGTPWEGTGIGIKITFTNGNFDLLTFWEPTHYYKEENHYISDNNSYICFKDGTLFKSLIAKYSE